MALVLHPVGRVGHALAGALLSMLLVTCGSDGSSEPPWGLDELTQPADEASVSRVLDALPATVAGKDRASAYDLMATYGEQDQIRFRAIRLGEQAEAEGFPGTAGGYLEGLVRGGEIEIEAQLVGADGDFAFVSGTTIEATEGPGGTFINQHTLYFVGWGEPDAEWLFTISANSAEERVALVEAFIAAVRSAR